MEIVEIERGETRTVEFKKELPQDSSKWIKTVVAFANGAGGKLLIGVSNLDELELRKKRRYYDELPMSELAVTDSDIEYL